MLDLADDCSRFVIGYFEIISASSPHIYHSALVLTPKTSIIRKLYESHARPFTRVVHGMPESWDSSNAVAVCPFKIKLAVWSSCNRFIAVSPKDFMTVNVLDSATLQQLQSFNFPSGEESVEPESLVFSPESRMVTCFSCHPPKSWRPERDAFVVSWDLQTGCIVSAIRCQPSGRYVQGSARITYSTNGKTVAVLCWYSFYSTISIYDVATGVFMHNVHHSDLGDVSRPKDGIPALFDIWTHGESLRFVTPGSKTTINIWEVELAPGAWPIRVETHSVPNINQRSTFGQRRNNPLAVHTRFLPTLSRLAFNWGGSLRVTTCGARPSEFLICDTKDATFFPDVTFSSDGRFFACPTAESVYLWIESSTSYVLHAKLTSGKPLLSPNGESIVTLNGPIIRLWHTKTLTTPAAGISTGPSHRGDFVVEFHPNMPLGMVVRQGDDMVTILDLSSGIAQSTINAGMEVYGLRVTESAVVVIGSEEVVAWNLPGGGNHSGATTGIEDSIYTITLGNNNPNKTVVAASISLNLDYIVRAREAIGGCYHLSIYRSSTHHHLRSVYVKGNTLWFAPNGHKIFCTTDGNNGDVVEISQSGHVSSTPVANIDSEHQSWRFPWSPPPGHRVTNDGWILGLNGRRLLILPPPWRSSAVRRVWNGQFLALLHGELPDPVILELEQ